MSRASVSVFDFFARFPDEAACWEHLFATKLGGDRPCPTCGEVGRWSGKIANGLYRHSCGKRLSLKVDTLFHDSNVSLLVWFYVILLFANSTSGVRGDFLKRQLGIDRGTAGRMALRIRLQMAALESMALMGGPGEHVYLDEALMPAGGDNPSDERFGPIVFGCATKDRVRTVVLPDRKRETVSCAIEECVAPGSILVSDAHGAYEQLGENGWKHIVIDHSKAFHDFRGNTCNAIESYWGSLKRMIRLYRRIPAGRLWLYIAESQFRYNRRKNHFSQFNEMIGSCPEISDRTIPQLHRKFDMRGQIYV